MHHLIHDLTNGLERNSDPSKHLLTLIFQQLAIPRIRVPNASMDLSLDTSKIQGGIKDQDRMVCFINTFTMNGGRVGGDLRQIPAE
jgi:hypothetical protein